MDINKIFGAFDSSSNSWDGDSSQYMGFYTYKPKIDENHPKYFVNMFWKLIVNHLSYGKKLVDFFGQADPSLAVGEIEYAGERMLFARAYTFIKRIDLDDYYHQKILIQEDSKELRKAYKLAIKFYEEEEEYERCAFLKKQLDFIKSSS